MAEKDRFGDTLKEAERGREDQYFAQRDQELMAKLKEAKADDREVEAASAARGRCPRDGDALHARRLHGVAIDECPTCKGMWLDEGEWKILAERERGSFFGRWFLGDRDA